MSTFTKLLASASLAALVASSAMAADPSTQTMTQPPAVTATDTAQSDGSVTPTPGPHGAQQPADPKSADATGTTTAPAQPGQDAAQMQSAALEVGTQAIQDGKVTIEMAWMPEAGYVAVHPLVNGRLGADALGYAPLQKGDNENVAVLLNTDIASDTVLVAMLHKDTGKTGTYEFASTSMDQDTPELIAGRPIAVAFQVMPQQGQPNAGAAQHGAATPETGGAAASDS